MCGVVCVVCGGAHRRVASAVRICCVVCQPAQCWGRPGHRLSVFAAQRQQTTQPRALFGSDRSRPAPKRACQEAVPCRQAPGARRQAPVVAGWCGSGAQCVLVQCVCVGAASPRLTAAAVVRAVSCRVALRRRNGSSAGRPRVAVSAGPGSDSDDSTHSAATTAATARVRRSRRKIAGGGGSSSSRRRA
jgi:hypothetical protein